MSITKRESHNPSLLNVGWLSIEFPFEKGYASQEFKDKLLKFCADEFIVLIARGFHECEFCGLAWTQWHSAPFVRSVEALPASV